MKVRSGCPINLAVEVLGDGWSLVVLRDVLFGDRRTYGELHSASEEGIATNILASRLKSLVEAGLLTGAPDPAHRQRVVYSLTEASIQLVPVMTALGTWGTAHLPVSHLLSVRARVLADGGTELQEALMDELRVRHLGADIPLARPLASERLERAYEAALQAH
ncbi:MAG: helix-turn-helix domain-containing protein [Myxococcota bacterium]